MMKNKIKNMPKVELHLHLDGSVSLETASRLSGLSIDQCKEKMIANEKCQNLSEYLTKFDFPISLMQTEENLKKVAENLVQNLAKQNVIYAEIRFAPMFHTKKGLSYEKIVEAVLQGLNTNSRIKTNLILCLMRGMETEENLKTLQTAEKYLNKGVCAIDLAGDEGVYPIDNYLELFNIAKEKGIPFTIHAGESGGAEEIRKAINIGAKRIGHGIHCLENEDVVKLIHDKKILLEICPTSNIQTRAVKEYSSHPIYKLYKKGIYTCVNTDNVTVSNISLTEEYFKLAENFNFAFKDFKQMNIYALEKAFIKAQEKEELMKLYQE